MKIRKLTIRMIIIYIIAWSAGVIWVLPFIGIFMASIRPYEEILRGWWVFEEFNFTLANYIQVWSHTTIPMMRPMINSFFVSILGTVIPMILGALAGYAFCRHIIPFKSSILMLMLVLLTIPLQMLAVPIFKMMHSLALVDTFTSLILINTATALPWIIFFMMNFFSIQPIEVEEAAKIDGASSFQIFYRVALPQSIPALGSVFVLQFIWCWVDFFLPLILIYSPEKYMAVQVIPMMRGEFMANWGLISAASVLVTAVPFLIFMFLQKYYIRGSIGWFAGG